MASAQKPQAHDVLVEVSVQHARPDFQYSERRIIIEQDKPAIIPIGRTSKRLNSLEAKADNCYFDSPVMSRLHAKITVDWFHKKLFVKDLGSLHGTYHNSQRMDAQAARELKQGDTLKFGIDIQRGNELFPPCTIVVHYEFDHSAKLARDQAQSTNRPTFTVPDESDNSDSEDDNATESDIRTTIEKIRRIDTHRSALNLNRLVRDPIDLTMDSPNPDCELKGKVYTPIIIDEENTLIHAPEPGNTIRPTQTEPTTAEHTMADLDAPHEEDDILPSSPKSDFLLPPACDSEYSSEDSYDDDESLDEYPDEEPSSQDQISGASDEDICLSDSESEDFSGDEDLDEENESVSDDDDESPRREFPTDGFEDCQMNDNDDNESQQGPLNSRNWGAPGPIGTYPDTQCNNNSAAEPFWLQPAPVSPSARPFRPPTMEPLPSLWPALPIQEQSEVERTKDFRLPSIMNLTEPQMGHQSEAGPQRISSCQSTDHSYCTTWPKAQQTFVPASSSVEKQFLPASQTDSTSAEMLGQMTGKPEFFAAREYNKAIMRHRQGGPESIEMAMPNMPINEDASSVLQPSGAIIDAAAEMVKEAPKSTNVAESVWSASGEKFLNTPQDFPVSNVRTSSPDFDMTSAFQFQQSKIASNSPMTAELPLVRTVATKTDLDQQQISHKSPKRKADEISTSTPQEEAAEAKSSQQSVEVTHATQNSDAPGATASNNWSTSTSTLPTATFANSSAPPPPKRLRSFLSKASYFLGGGVLSATAVVTALAVTAPTL
ncbi:Factor arrest protein 10 [Colletotrichum chlorophyti]|uniref:Factor arrest protein 10 n=1 Tax=Colletotrichum chlorophyti TaxID=708187 RepID=A0A1Q8RMJ3_9PEZI|nr:Factor arrest protein 10 [Colletotrichum chlorophyti]